MSFVFLLHVLPGIAGLFLPLDSFVDFLQLQRSAAVGINAHVEHRRASVVEALPLMGMAIEVRRHPAAKAHDGRIMRQDVDAPAMPEAVAEGDLDDMGSPR